MKYILSLLLPFIFFAGSTTTSQAQLLNRLKNRVIDKIENRIEDKIVEELSEEIARRAMKPIDKAFDQMLYSSYRKEYGEEYNDKQIDSIMQESGRGINEFLTALNKAANVPSAYSLDYHMIMESKEENGDKVENEMWFSESQAIIAMSNIDQKENMMIIDMDNDVVVMYSDENGKKKAQAIPSMMSIASAYMEANDESFIEKGTQIEGPGKSKNIAGYQAQKYTVESEKTKGEYYISSDVPINWNNVYANAMKQYSPKLYNEATGQVKGMVLEGKFEDKKSKKKSSFKTKKIEKKSLLINNSEYEIKGVMEQ